MQLTINNNYELSFPYSEKGIQKATKQIIRITGETKSFYEYINQGSKIKHILTRKELKDYSENKLIKAI